MGTRGFASFRNKLRRGKRKLQKSEKEIPRRAGVRGVSNIKRELIESDLVASTELWRSVGYRSLSPSKVAINVDAPYAGYVEKGTGAKGAGKYPAPDNVPIREIFEWMQQKPTFVGVPPDGGDMFTLAMIIAESLEEEGQRQQPFFEPAWNDTVDYTKRQMREALRSAF